MWNIVPDVTIPAAFGRKGGERFGGDFTYGFRSVRAVKDPSFCTTWRLLKRKLHDFLSDACLSIGLELNCSRSYSKDNHNPDLLNRNHRPKSERKKELPGRKGPRCVSCREVFGAMPSTPSFLCKVLQRAVVWPSHRLYTRRCDVTDAGWCAACAWCYIIAAPAANRPAV